ncbi:MAG: hypothetical protein ACOY58_08160, partial [Candidatus Micrarchaeota archaeon]
MTFRERNRKRYGDMKQAMPKGSEAPKAAPQPPKATPLIETPRADREDASERSVQSGEIGCVLLKDSVPRIRLGSVITGESLVKSEEHGAHAHVWGLGRRKRPKLRVVRDGDPHPASQEESADDWLDEQLLEANAKLEQHALAPEEGPYSENSEAVGRFSEMLLEGLEDGDLDGIIDRLIRIHPDITEGFASRYNEDHMAPDELPTAAAMLEQPRIALDEVTGGVQFTFCHPLEMYVLAAAVLRRNGYNAFPARAIVPHPELGETGSLLMAIVDMSKEVPLTTFDLYPMHPPAGAIELMSDTAVMGALHAMQAETRVKRFIMDMITTWNESKGKIPDDREGEHLEGIAMSLFQSARRWDGNRLIPRTTAILQKELVETLPALDPAMNEPDFEAQPRSVTAMGMAIYPTYAATTAERYVQHVQALFARMITSG